MKKLTLTAGLLRIILLASLVLLILCAALGFYYTQGLLRQFAVDASHLNAKAAMSEQNLGALQSIEEYLANHTKERKRAAGVVAESKAYRYQNEIIADIRAFARDSDVTITEYTFNEDSTAGAAPANGNAKAAPAKPTVSGLKSKTVSIGVKSPVRYTNLLNFIHRIEQNTTKMQIASVSLSRADKSASTHVATNAFIVEVYTR